MGGSLNLGHLVIASGQRATGAECAVAAFPETARDALSPGFRVRDGAAFQPGVQLDQRAKGIFGSSRNRSQTVTVVEAPRYMAFAGPMGTSAARWGMDLEPIDDRQTDTMMWVEVDLAGMMRAIPAGALKRRVQRVSDTEMVLIKSALESAMSESVL